jgi:hypothetical protein
MGILANIFDKLGLGHSVAHPVPDVRPLDPKHAGPNGGGGGGGFNTAPPGPRSRRLPRRRRRRKPISEIDVVAQLERRAAANPQKLNWRTSIVDLLKLLDMDSSLDERKALAKELGAPASVMSDSAEMNMWLHKEVLQRVAANGGNVPANLLD